MSLDSPNKTRDPAPNWESLPADGPRRTPVIHVLDGVLLGKQYLWGKEQVVSNLMHEQRRSGRFDPALAVFAPCLLSDRIKADGFPVMILDDVTPGSAWRGLRTLVRHLREHPGAMLHTHGFKASVTGRLARALGAPMSGLVSTSHGFDNSAARLWVYNALDCLTGPASDIVTAPDEAMLGAFVPTTNTRFVPNAIPDQPPPTAEERAAGRARFGWSEDDFVIGAMGRLSVSKGIAELIALAGTMRSPVRFAVAGVGPMQAEIDRCDPARIQALGYVSPSDEYIASIDMYVQPSHSEGLSLSLLQAMRAGIPIVATRVNATKLVIDDGINGILVEPRSTAALAAGIQRVLDDPGLGRRLGAAARARFLDGFRIEAQARAYDDLYAGVRAARSRRSGIAP